VVDPVPTLQVQSPEFKKKNSSNQKNKKCTGPEKFQISDSWILEYLHIHNEIPCGMGHKSKHKIHLYFTYTLYTLTGGNFMHV
jgi:hypothetical protein